MSPQEQQSILSIALLAAFADGNKADSERESIRQLAQSLGSAGGGADLAVAAPHDGSGGGFRSQQAVRCASVQ